MSKLKVTAEMLTEPVEPLVYGQPLTAAVRRRRMAATFGAETGNLLRLLDGLTNHHRICADAWANDVTGAPESDVYALQETRRAESLTAVIVAVRNLQDYLTGGLPGNYESVTGVTGPAADGQWCFAFTAYLVNVIAERVRLTPHLEPVDGARLWPQVWLVTAALLGLAPPDEVEHDAG